MAKRKHVDLSNEEPGLRADPVMESLNFEVTPKRVTIGTSTHGDSRLSAGGVSLIILAGVLACGVGAGLLAFWVGMGPVGCMVSAAVGAVVALVVTAAIFRTKTRSQGTAVDYTPETRPPVVRASRKPKAGKKRKKRR
ncbi:hypothetical protein ACIOK4_44205 [Streptomyces bottropensis]|uniref:hypothetical protein n=1 Tax=Streptomyces bottropensis TaxID=42235 RepID=UPI003821200E